ncbi:trypsin-like peptidase domain-containing protein [Salsipaludibacter albus]|uniref:trypsin-like peptidase domain-containing protein n=1 Tax=Salsipaludibacter albus TaxID=2849650 RepID=UPI001EE439D5|nr:S1C family serine protease [Salsipaludibacter albus]MBY5164440.1 S1C family serine protease [Salsipaludibacter albus]
MTCPQCGGTWDYPARPCPHCGAQPQDAPDAAPADPALLLPSGAAGGLLVVVLAALLFAGVWWGFDRLTTDAAASRATAPTAVPSPPAVAARVSPTPSPMATDPAPEPEPTVDPARAWDPVLQQTADALVTVAATSCDATTVMGAGFTVAPRRIVTAAHLLGDASAVEVRRGDRAQPARVLARDADADLALLALDDSLGDATLALVDRPVAIGQRVAPATLGADGASVVPATVSGVDVTVVTRRGTLPGILRTDARVDGALAGAPLLAPSGRVAGVVLADHVTSAVGDLGFAVPASVLAQRLEAWASTRPTPLVACPTAAPSPMPAPEPRTEGGWIAVLESLPVEQFDRADADRRARAYAGRIDDRTRVLRSTDWPTLNPGYWVVWTGTHPSRDAARAACAEYGSGAPVCYPREARRPRR